MKFKPAKRRLLVIAITSLLTISLAISAGAWGPHPSITRAACATLPASDRLNERLVGVEALEEYCWLGDYREDAFETYYPDDYLIFPKAPRHFGHLLPEVANTYEPFFHRALQALRTESPHNAARWVGSLLHFQQDSGSPPHALPIGGELHAKLENWLDAKAIQLGDYQPRLLGEDDADALRPTSAFEGFRKRMDELVEFSKLRAQRARPFCEANNRAAAEPVILESALETSRVTADLLHTLLVLASKAQTNDAASLTVRITAPPLLALPQSPARLILQGTDFSTVADPIEVDDKIYVGECVFRHLPPGEYRPLVYRTGCKAAMPPAVRLRAGERKSIEVALQSDEVEGNLIRDAERKISYSTPGQLEHWQRIGSGDGAAWQTAAIPVREGATYRIGVRLEQGVTATVRARWDQYVNFGPALRSDLIKTGNGTASVPYQSEFVAPPKARLVRLLIFTQRPLGEVLDHAWVVKDVTKPLEIEVRYRRENGTVETEIRRNLTADGLRTLSVTQQGNVKLALVVQQTLREELHDAQVTLESTLNPQPSTLQATATYRDGKANVHRSQQEQTFTCLPQLIVTSAPDWTDVVLLCLKYDRRRGGKQQFPALWFHPTQRAQQTTFSAEWTGSQRIQWGFLFLKVNRLMLTIRGGSRYVAWAMEDGRMMKLIPVNGDGTLRLAGSLYLEGYENATRELR